MRADAPTAVDLDALALRPGEAAKLELEVEPVAPRIGGELLALPEPLANVRIDVSRTSAGYALRLRFGTAAEGTCSRCLGPARVEAAVDAREVEQASENDPELLSPYVEDGVLDIGAWVRDALMLALPERLLCRPDCAGLCEICGISLNDLEPGSHTHEAPLDPRFAKLRELADG
ncbi:MAG: DUF177 domain-containing protein [Solirubrobacterales bacterium]|nr:DUF177 domain-containing protein [Solirubrobacterales bacterium]